jgi:hypothetical protein
MTDQKKLTPEDGGYYDEWAEQYYGLDAQQLHDQYIRDHPPSKLNVPEIQRLLEEKAAERLAKNADPKPGLVERVMASHPRLTREEAIQAIIDFGG